MIGKLIMLNCLSGEGVETITSITRKTLGIKHPKLIEIIHADFLNYSGIEQHFKNKDVCFYCIGVYTGQVQKKEFKKITVTYTKVFAETLKQNSPNLSFCFLSGQGADSSEKSSILFAREKGIAENGLIKLKFKSLHIFRPGYIYPVTPRAEPNLSYRIMRVLYKPVSLIFPNVGVTSVKLAEKMMEVGLNGGDKLIYENKDLRI